MHCTNGERTTKKRKENTNPNSPKCAYIFSLSLSPVFARYSLAYTMVVLLNVQNTHTHTHSQISINNNTIQQTPDQHTTSYIISYYFQRNVGNLISPSHSLTPDINPIGNNKRDNNRKYHCITSLAMVCAGAHPSKRSL